METNEHYCVKCKAARVANNVRQDENKTKNGRTMERGVCPTCGTNTARIR
jgi:hypothetical protein